MSEPDTLKRREPCQSKSASITLRPGQACLPGLSGGGGTVGDYAFPSRVGQTDHLNLEQPVA